MVGVSEKLLTPLTLGAASSSPLAVSVNAANQYVSNGMGLAGALAALMALV